MSDPISSAPVPADDAPTTGIRLPIGIPGLGTIPRPVWEAAEKEAKAVLNGDAAATGLLISTLGFFGVSAASASYVVGLLGLALGAVAYVTTALAQAQAARRVARDAEPLVTPTAKPSAADGVPLVKVTEVVA